MPIEILMPALSPTMTEGTLAKWLIKEGDTVKSGKVIAEIETDKATMEVEAVDEGAVGKLLVKEGTEGVPVNQAIALLLAEGEDKKALEKYEVKAAPAAKSRESEVESRVEATQPQQQSAAMAMGVTQVPTTHYQLPASASRATSNEQRATGSRLFASPLARRVAAEKGVRLELVQGSGPRGRIVKADVEDAAARGSGGGIVRRNPREVEEIPNSGMRKTIAKRLLESKQTVPHFYLTIDCKLGRLLDARAQINAAGMQGREVPPLWKVSVNDMIVKACGLALRDVPAANASWTDAATLRYANADVSVAVALEGGLITPIVRNADQKSIPAISQETKTLVARAKGGKLQPEEYVGGGFSLSNLGMYGITQFAAIVNPPQGCILAVGAGEERAVIENGQVKAVTVMTCTLSCDHRVVDGAVGAEFLAAFKRYVEEPVRMIL